MNKIILTLSLCLGFLGIAFAATDLSVELGGPKAVVLIENNGNKSYKDGAEKIFTAIPVNLNKEELTGGKPETKAYTYAHEFNGKKVAEISYVLFYRTNASYVGKGKFIESAFIKVKEIKVTDNQVWKVKLTAEARNLVNVGTVESPVVAFDLVLSSYLERPTTPKEDYTTQLKRMVHNITGDGKVTDR